MKSCNEMTGSVFARIEEHRKLQKRQRKLLAKAVFPIIGICLALLIIFLAQPKAESKKQIISESDKPENRIVINQIDGISADRMYICLLWEDYVPMNKEELIEYYGINVFPDVPEDLREWDSENGSAGYGIYRRDGGTGEVYHDGNVLNYSNEDFTRSINIEFSKGKLPFTCCGDFEHYCEMSEICGVEVGIGQSDNGHYLVEFMYADVGFRMIIEGLSIDEIESVIESIIL